MLRLVQYFLIISSLCASLLGCTAQIAVQPASHRPAATQPLVAATCASLRWESLAPDLWVLYGHEGNSTPANEGRVSNILFARENTDAKQMPSRGWLIGSGPSQRMGQLVRCSLEQQLGAMVTDVVSPRAHPESVLGASAFANTVHWALPEVALAMQSRCPRCSQQLAAMIAETSIAQQSIFIPKQPIYTGPATVSTHSEVPTLGPFQVWSVPLDTNEWTTLLRHTTSGLWFAPGLVWGDTLVPDLRDTDVYRVIAALQVLEKFTPKQILPEQGRAATLAMLQANTQYWLGLESRTALAIRQGAADVNALTVGVTPPAQAAPANPTNLNSAMNRDRHSLNQQRVWRQLEQIYFDAPKP
jgi:hypothetical protein